MKKLLLLFLGLAGCATAPTFPEVDTTWTTHTGQLRYTTSERTIIGEFFASHRGDAFRLEFSKGGAFPLLRVARHRERATADGPMALGSWTGLAEGAPAYLRSWTTAVPAAIAQPHGPTVEVAGTQPGESFIFVFNR